MYGGKKKNTADTRGALECGQDKKGKGGRNGQGTCFWHWFQIITLQREKRYTYKRQAWRTRRGALSTPRSPVNCWFFCVCVFRLVNVWQELCFYLPPFSIFIFFVAAVIERGVKKSKSKEGASLFHSVLCVWCPAKRRTAYDGHPADSAYAHWPKKK